MRWPSWWGDQRRFLGPNEIERQVNATLRSGAPALAAPAPRFRGLDRAKRQAMANMAAAAAPASPLWTLRQAAVVAR